MGAWQGMPGREQRLVTISLKRIMKYDAVAVPAAVEYKWLEAKCEKFPHYPVLSYFFQSFCGRRRKLFERLHKNMFNHFMMYIWSWEFYYKSGQKTATNFSGVIPEIYVDKFQPFLNDIPVVIQRMLGVFWKKSLVKKEEFSVTGKKNPLVARLLAGS